MFPLLVLFFTCWDRYGFIWFIHSKTACIWLKIQNHQQANCNDSTVNDDIVVNKWDATFDLKLNILNISDFGFNKILPGNLASSTIPVLSNRKAVKHLNATCL